MASYRRPPVGVGTIYRAGPSAPWRIVIGEVKPGIMRVRTLPQSGVTKHNPTCVGVQDIQIFLMQELKRQGDYQLVPL